MKILEAVKFICLSFIITLVISGPLDAQSFYEPHSVYYCAPGQSSVALWVSWQDISIPDQTMGRTRSGYTGNGYYWLSTLGIFNFPWTSTFTSYPIGTHSISITTYEEYYNVPGDYYTWQVIGAGSTFFTVLPATHGNQTSYVQNTTSGSQSDSKTSSYISPGSIVSWNLHVTTFNVSPAITTATAQIGSPISQSVSRYNTGYYTYMEGDNNGSYNYTNGGTLTLTTNVSISSNNGCGGTAQAYISW